MGTRTTRFTVNGKQVQVDVEPRTSLADALRRDLKLTGTHIGCEHGVCGTCTFIVDGAAIRSCLMLAAQADGTQITTVEGLPRGAAKAWPACRKLQEASRAAMRLLHAGHFDHGACTTERGA